MVRISVCTHLFATYRLSIAYLAKLPCAVRAGYSSGNHKPCLKGTREGVIRDIEAWEADEMNESVYWLKGVAGCGKSTIAQSFAERSAAKGKLGASFFCSRDYPDRRNLHLIFLTLARDLACWSADFKTALVPIICANPNVQDDSLPVQLEKLLVRPFKKTHLSATIIVDALDECEDKEPVSEFLSALAVHVNSMPTVRFFITGRPEDRIRSGFKLPSLRTKELPLHDVDSATVDSDIKSFVAYRLDEIATRRRQSISGQWPSDRDIAVVLKKTSGLFIIASVILRFVDSPFASPQKRLKLIVDPQESTIYEGRSGIDVVYHQILSASFEHADENDAVFFDQLHLVVGSIVLALKPLPRASLAEILEMTPEDIWTILTHLHSILIVPESESEPIRILHKSFADFITDKERCPDERHFIDAPPHHSVLGIHCLKLMKIRLMKNICGLPRYVMNHDVEDLPARRELCITAPLSYACSSWAKHLQLSSQAGGNTSSVLMLINDFFTRHLLSWLEVLSIEECLHTAIYSLHDVRSWLIEVSTSYCCNSSAVPHSRLRILINIYRT
jgi:NACHT domain